MDILNQLRERAEERLNSLSREEAIIRGLFNFDLFFKPTVKERTFSYSVITAECLHQGACYAAEDVTLDRDLMGKDARNVDSEYRCVETAILDALYANFNRQKSYSLYLEGTAKEKARPRAEIVVNEATRFFDNKIGKKALNVGVVGEFIPLLESHGLDVSLTDMDPQLLGHDINGIPVENGELKTLSRVEESDVAIVTGMTISTHTLDDILQIAKKYDTKLVVFAETGAYFGEELCRMGVDTVVSEPFPFYIFDGTSRIDIYRREDIVGEEDV